eukprot:scaffold112060_cov32-Attheya_sp.AAC.1
MMLRSLLCLALAAIAAATDEAGLAFLKDNAEKEGVMELPSGLQYKILRNGTGAFHPDVGTSCNCHYEGTLIDGTKFDSSYDRGEPTAFAPNQVIRGWTDAMQLMVEGDKWEMYIPSELAYGESGSMPKIPPGAALIFVMELLEIQGDEKIPAIKCDATTLDHCNERETGYLKKIAAWDAAKRASEGTRLQKIMAGDGTMKPELEQWIQRRLYILNQLIPSSPDKIEL